ncbi:TfoX/Sxy family protein [Parvibaculum sp.]|jgi:DNA transformation protein and related proteins|uniref:TfoX/Sxy family protein n=1 Tax=Parvibaculum sp. TaxID=2024848 RepID=UPI000C463634|nr:TfoX/Sxy family protein [Parvibaculum sp.]MAM96122.1 transcriptional regulator [Parvibaculum sp.]HCX69423.1 transcriptional regulator [Rhodobiaceae bacterium]|tara:strand:- start:10962 stop:11351 length:390 start_codon:yes stop_codon:yes gene_type:complete
MAVSDEYKAFVAELLEPLGTVRIRNMFGGAGVYLDDLMFGLIAGETLYFKVDGRNRPDFEADEMGPFLYEPPSGKTVAMSYYELPERLYDDPDELVHWARKALDAALASKAAKSVKKKPAQKKTARSEI